MKTHTERLEDSMTNDDHEYWSGLAILAGAAAAAKKGNLQERIAAIEAFLGIA